jgi:hypothetical protein
MSKDNGNKPYLNKTGKQKKSGMKETLIYGNGNTLEERENAKKKYKNNKLNE